MKTSVNRAELRQATESCTVLSVNGHSLSVESTNKTDSGKQRFTVIVDGKKYENQYLKGVQAHNNKNGYPENAKSRGNCKQQGGKRDNTI